jgi:hypothetical protein
MRAALNLTAGQIGAQSATPAILTNPEQLQSLLGDWELVLVDSREPEAYSRGHLLEMVS